MVLRGQRTVSSGSLNIPRSENRQFRFLDYSGVIEPSVLSLRRLRGHRTVGSISLSIPAKPENRRLAGPLSNPIPKPKGFSRKT